MNILIWHVHGSWTTSFVQGGQTYLVPVVPDRGADGHGRARTWDWPATVIELGPEQIADAEVDVVVVQSERDLELAYAWLGGRCPGRDVPVIWLEHNTPQGRGPGATKRLSMCRLWLMLRSRVMSGTRMQP